VLYLFACFWIKRVLYRWLWSKFFFLLTTGERITLVWRWSAILQYRLVVSFFFLDPRTTDYLYAPARGQGGLRRSLDVASRLFAMVRIVILFIRGPRWSFGCFVLGSYPAFGLTHTGQWRSKHTVFFATALFASQATLRSAPLISLCICCPFPPLLLRFPQLFPRSLALTIGISSE